MIANNAKSNIKSIKKNIVEVIKLKFIVINYSYYKIIIG